MGAFLSGLENVASKIGSVASNPTVQKGLQMAGTAADAYAPQQLSPAQATGQPVAAQGPGFSGVQQPKVGDGIASLITALRARHTATPLGKSPDIGGGGIGAPPLGYTGDSVR